MRLYLLLRNIGLEVEKVLGENRRPDHVNTVKIRRFRPSFQELLPYCKLLLGCLGCREELHPNSSLPREFGQFFIEATLIVSA